MTKSRHPPSTTALFEALTILHENSKTTSDLFLACFNLLAVFKACYFIGTDEKFKELMTDAIDRVVGVSHELLKQAPLTLAVLRGEGVDPAALAEEVGIPVEELERHMPKPSRKDPPHGKTRLH